MDGNTAAIGSSVELQECISTISTVLFTRNVVVANGALGVALAVKAGTYVEEKRRRRGEERGTTRCVLWAVCDV